MFFDNVGGETLDIVLETIAQKGVLIQCGAVSQYSLPKEKQYRIANSMEIVKKSLRVQGKSLHLFEMAYVGMVYVGICST